MQLYLILCKCCSIYSVLFPACYHLFPTQLRPELRCSRWHWHKPSGRGKLAWMKSLMAHKAEVLEKPTYLESVCLTKVTQDGTQTIIHTTNCQNDSAKTHRAIAPQYPGWTWQILVTWMHVNAQEHSSTLGWWHRPLVTWRFETALHWWSISQPHFGRILAEFLHLRCPLRNWRLYQF